jgi:hypothetical protein
MLICVNYVILKTYDIISNMFPTANLLGFNLWGRGLVTRKCAPRKNGTVLEPCWNLSLLGCKAGLIFFSLSASAHKSLAPACHCRTLIQGASCQPTPGTHKMARPAGSCESPQGLLKVILTQFNCGSIENCRKSNHNQYHINCSICE